MEPEFWLQAWETGRTPFHVDEVHAGLREDWPKLGLRPGSRVLVPLCGKSLDLDWLVLQGHEVLGVELSPIACHAVFERGGPVPAPRVEGAFSVWQRGPLTILQGDLFQLPPSLRCDAIYDRAATVALPADLRTPYAATLAGCLAPGGPMVLVTFEDPAAGDAGPPFSVGEAEVRRLYEGCFHVERVSRSPYPGDGPDRAQRVRERWRLVRR